MADVQRIQLAQTISTRDPTMNYDAILWNYYATKNSNGQILCERRFGIQPAYSVTAAPGLGLFQFQAAVLSIIGTEFYVNGVATATVDGTSPYQFTLTGTGGTAVFLDTGAGKGGHLSWIDLPAQTV